MPIPIATSPGTYTNELNIAKSLRIEPDWSKLSAEDAAQLAVDADLFGLRCTITDEDGIPHRIDPECVTFDRTTGTFTVNLEKAGAYDANNKHEG